MDAALRWAQSQSSLLFDGDQKVDKKTTFKVSRVEEDSARGGWSPGTFRRHDSDSGSKKHSPMRDDATASLSQSLTEILKTALDRVGSNPSKQNWQRGNKKNGYGKGKGDNNRSPSSAGGQSSAPADANSQSTPPAPNPNAANTAQQATGNGSPPRA